MYVKIAVYTQKNLNTFFVELQSSKSPLSNLRFTRHNFLEYIQKHEHPAVSRARRTRRRYKT